MRHSMRHSHNYLLTKILNFLNVLRILLDSMDSNECVMTHNLWIKYLNMRESKKLSLKKKTEIPNNWSKMIKDRYLFHI
jgi:hypothetical protein